MSLIKRCRFKTVSLLCVYVYLFLNATLKYIYVMSYLERKTGNVIC